MMKYKSLFIDLDDTLWDTYHNNKDVSKSCMTTSTWGGIMAPSRRCFPSISHTMLSCGHNIEGMK